MRESILKPLKIKGKVLKVPIVQGGMGAGVSLEELAGSVAKEGGMGTISSALLDRLVSKKNGRPFNSYEAAYWEVSRAKELASQRESGGLVAINIMVALVRDYEPSVRGALDAGVDAIISGAGLPLTLPTLQKPKETALIPIVSSARALNIICKRWEKMGYRPDAVVLEGPLAGGHLGFKFDEVEDERFSLENLFPSVKDIAMSHGDFPVIVAGGIFSHEDNVRWQKRGADVVQMGTRFLATVESRATAAYKLAVVQARKEDIQVVSYSPCDLPFRILTFSPMYLEALKRLRPPKCDLGYLLRPDANGNYTQCKAKGDNEHYFDICNGLASSCGNKPEEAPLYTVGTNAYRVTEILPVKTLMDELKGPIG